jgi:hypothetical protein
MNLNDCFKKHFPEYTILNYTKKLESEIYNGILYCLIDHKLLIYMKRSPNTENYFLGIEKENNVKDIKLICINKDNYYYVSWDLTGRVEATVKYFKNSIFCESNSENCCIVCYDDYNVNSGLTCSICINWLCNSCVNNLINKNCPICRSNNYMPSIGYKDN